MNASTSSRHVIRWSNGTPNQSTSAVNADTLPTKTPRRGSAPTPRVPSAPTSSTSKCVTLPSEAKCMVTLHHKVYVGLKNGEVACCDGRTGELMKPFLSSHPSSGCVGVWSMVAVMDRLWVGYSNGDIEVFDTTPIHRLAYRLQKHTGGVYCMTEFNNNVFSGSNDFEIFQWCATEVVFKRQLAGHTNYVRCMTAVGAHLYSGSDDHTVRVWDVATGQCVRVITHHKHGVSTISRVGIHLWTGDDSGTICVWEAAENGDLKTTLKEHNARVVSLRKIGSRVYSGGADHEILMWDATTWQLLGKVLEHRGWVTCIANPNVTSKYTVWTASHDNTIRQFQHEEYHVVTADRARFDDAHWYYSSFNPYEEYNTRLREHCEILETKYKQAQVDTALALGKVEASSDKLRALECEKLQIQDNYQSVCSELRMVTEGHVPALQKALQIKDTALTEATNELAKAKEEIIRLKYGTVESDAAFVESQRSLKLLTSENENLKTMLDDLKKRHKEQLDKDTSAMMQRMEDLRKDCEASEKKLTEELRVMMVMNDSFRDQNASLRKALDVAQQQASLFMKTPRPPTGGGGSGTSGRETPKPSPRSL